MLSGGKVAGSCSVPMPVLVQLEIPSSNLLLIHRDPEGAPVLILCGCTGPEHIVSRLHNVKEIRCSSGYASCAPVAGKRDTPWNGHPSRGLREVNPGCLIDVNNISALCFLECSNQFVDGCDKTLHPPIFRCDYILMTVTSSDRTPGRVRFSTEGLLSIDAGGCWIQKICGVGGRADICSICLLQPVGVDDDRYHDDQDCAEQDQTGKNKLPWMHLIPVSGSGDW